MPEPPKTVFADPHSHDAASEPYGCTAPEVGDAQMLDVRRADAFTRATTMIAGAQWRDPEQVEQWGRELAPGRPVVVYCVHGHAVSRSTASRLHAMGADARFLRGGIADWEAAGRPVQPRH